MKVAGEIFAAYIITAVLVNGGIFYRFREWMKARTPRFFKGSPPRHLIDCRMCTGFWVSLGVSSVCGDWLLFPLIYGASYFLATQER
jgi:hypothetical protein